MKYNIVAKRTLIVKYFYFKIKITTPLFYYNLQIKYFISTFIYLARNLIRLRIRKIKTKTFDK